MGARKKHSRYACPIPVPHDFSIREGEKYGKRKAGDIGEIFIGVQYPAACVLAPAGIDEATFFIKKIQ